MFCEIKLLRNTRIFQFFNRQTNVGDGEQRFFENTTKTAKFEVHTKIR